MQGDGEIIVGLDIGTTKICAVVGEVSGTEINITRFLDSISRGF